MAEKYQRFGKPEAFSEDEYVRRDQAFTETLMQDFGYQYTKVGEYELDLRPGSKTTRTIVENIHSCVNADYVAKSGRFPEWDDIDKVLGAYMPADSYDKKERQKDARKSQTIVIPMSHQNKEMWEAFIHRKSLNSGIIQRYRSVGSKKAKIAAALMELINARQSRMFMEATKLTNMAGQAFAYGRAFAAVRWTRETATKKKRVDPLMALQLLMRGISMPIGSFYSGEYVKAEGTTLDVIDIRKVFIDPNVSSNDIKAAQFVGYFRRTSLQEILEREADPEQKMFNGKAVKVYAGRGGSTSSWMPRTRTQYSPQAAIYDTDQEANDVSYPVDVIHCCINLIPRDWRLHPGTKPEKWFFAISCDDVIIQAYPLSYDHNEWPIIDCSPNCNGVDAFPTGHLSLTLEEQRQVDWALKTRNEAINSILTGFIAFDASKFDAAHFKKPGLGKLLPFRNSGFDARPISDYIYNFQMTDPTINHMDFVAQIMKMSADGLGTSEVMAGDLSSLPDRPGKAGIAAATGGPFARMSLLGARCEEQAFMRLANIKACNTRQYMQEDVYVPLIGGEYDWLKDEYNLEPGDDLFVSGDYGMEGTPGMAGIWDIADWDLEVESISVDSPALDDISQMGEVLKTAMGYEPIQMMIAQAFRWDDIFMRYFRKTGFSDINDFRAQNAGQPMPQTNVVTMPDEAVMQQAQAGNLIQL